jgi:hypothetical protein
MTDESLPGARCPIDRLSVPARNGAEIAKAALEGSCPSPPLFSRPGERDPERSRREPQRRRSGQGRCRDVGLLKAGQIDQGLLRFSYLAPEIVEAIVEGRQPRPLNHPAPAPRHSALLVRPARHIRVHPLGSRSKQPRPGPTTHNGLVGVSSPPGPTTQSDANRCFPVFKCGTCDLCHNRALGD